jgi:hypothetical protein
MELCGISPGETVSTYDHISKKLTKILTLLSVFAFGILRQSKRLLWIRIQEGKIDPQK